MRNSQGIKAAAKNAEVEALGTKLDTFWEVNQINRRFAYMYQIYFHMK